MFDTADLFGLSFVKAPSEVDVARRLLAWVSHEKSESAPLPMVVTPNVDIVVQMHEADQSRVHSIAQSSAVVLPDGAPLVWLSRLTGESLPARLAGSTVFDHFWPAVVAEERRFAMLCSSEAVQQGLLSEYPSAVIEVAPMIDTSDASIDEAAAAFAATALEAEAEFCVLGLGHPKDSLLCASMIRQWPDDRPVPLTLCLGGSAEMYLGIRKRAPEWAQRWGLEWLVRFLQEPRRMFYRYFVRDLRFIPLAIREVVRQRRTP